jgi:UDP-N-acetyl-D-glucosamine dehydrogenase
LDTDPIQHFTDGQWTAGVIGLGYVGLPLAVTAAGSGLRVLGYDVDQAKVDSLNEGTSHVEDVTDDELARHWQAGPSFTTDASRLSEADAIFIAVPSPLGRNRQPDTSYITSAAETIGTYCPPRATDLA